MFHCESLEETPSNLFRWSGGPKWKLVQSFPIGSGDTSNPGSGGVEKGGEKAFSHFSSASVVERLKPGFQIYFYCHSYLGK